MDLNELKSREIWLPYMLKDGKKPSLNGTRLFSWVKTPFRLSYDEALELQARTEGLAGIGFVVPIGILVVDLDKCVSSGDINEEAGKIVREFNSYCEKSPSRTGLHIICINDTHRVHTAHDIIINEQKVELKPAGNHYVTFTGDAINSLGLADCTELFKKYDPPELIRSNQDGAGPVIVAKETSHYGRQALNRECNNIRCATSRHTQVYASARNIGEIVAGGEITESDARASLEGAGRQSGLSKAKTMENMEAGLAKGMRSPRSRPRIVVETPDLVKIKGAA
jgi:hypothetical protein